MIVFALGLAMKTDGKTLLPFLFPQCIIENGSVIRWRHQCYRATCCTDGGDEWASYVSHSHVRTRCFLAIWADDVSAISVMV
jgi:hypothetical protein